VAVVAAAVNSRIVLLVCETRAMRKEADGNDQLRPFKRGTGRTTAGRSALMGRVRQARTRPEEDVALWLRSHGIAYRRNSRSLPGRPDFANRRAGFAIFVHGCFWHRHANCPRTTIPKRNREFWANKFAANVARDAARMTELQQLGLRVLTVWECETEDQRLLTQSLDPLRSCRAPTSR
jgi:DNA mismatch endonuclease (patch repair protein)